MVVLRSAGTQQDMPEQRGHSWDYLSRFFGSRIVGVRLIIACQPSPVQGTGHARLNEYVPLPQSISYEPPVLSTRTDITPGV